MTATISVILNFIQNQLDPDFRQDDRKVPGWWLKVASSWTWFRIRQILSASWRIESQMTKLHVNPPVGGLRFNIWVYFLFLNFALGFNFWYLRFALAYYALQVTLYVAYISWHLPPSIIVLKIWKKCCPLPKAKTDFLKFGSIFLFFFCLFSLCLLYLMLTTFPKSPYF